ncbi:MAG: response regulator transcription factor [Anaerolineaceae bacterium]|jgi:DNA-binding response OmpR family regulator|nr:response regulator transcription factor [Anaerolineaceae bacterium]MDD4043063.1 response regulator transcription factor [Anaerolineaceae bacterium]MDD4576937.1 response regulator transcription factor [Anaerolineaceae bacterium]
MSETILVVDDQTNVRKLLKDYLTSQGYRVVLASDGQSALFVARHEHPDLILLDIMMPGMDGFQFLSAFRRESQIPVIIITAREEETDAVLGLELGADDYVIKPFRMRELVARIRATLRRQGEQPEAQEFLRVGEILLDRGLHLVSVRGETVNLTPLEFDLLMTLMRTPGRVFTRTELVDRLLESGFTGLESTLNVHMRNLRRKIEIDPAKPEYLETVFGIGYRIIQDGSR